MKSVAILLALVGLLLLLCGSAQGVCCRAYLTLNYKIYEGGCGDVGGESVKNGCKVNICGDGKARVGTWCGRGSCNIFGCACRNGCLTGNWQQSFIDNNRGRKISITDAKWHK
ncbi:hypothetical protein KR222_009030 [Zaprionus bogoriensis]|nr:hypothetical protein KR222_009030 [Zaprionus bogoriensis]